MVAEATTSYPFRLLVHTLEHEPLSTVWVTKVMSFATPLESVEAMPVTVPSESFRMTVVSATSSVVPETLACSVTSNWRRRSKEPLPVTSTVVVSIDPSMNSMVAAPVMRTSLVLDITTSVSVNIPSPSVSIPTALFSMVMLLNSTEAEVREAYLNAAPVEPVMVPESAPPTSVW